MKIYILNKVLEFDNNLESIDDIFEKVKDIISTSNYILSHFEVDGDEVHDDFYDYFSQNIKNIEEVKVITKNIKDMTRDILISNIEYLGEAVLEVELLANEFYKEPNKESWSELVKLLESVRWLVDTFYVIDMSDELRYIVTSYEKWNLYAKDIYYLKDIMEGFGEVFKTDDIAFLPEILSDEILPLFKDMKDKLDTLVDREIDKSKLN
ncbi:hypothetical protein [Anaerosalibacter massiliensis]|uniref:Uncharacterized protein n=1 Tax=Anaerosalibacter massiliensis TaxID=1347392 RepID=A0A9X2MJF1_9FIRM|nr:hypothetical protein [Anaerosalibacter massiliensis]MCR2044749.1 hypothetical protein [Anaerosalibacter massiliensis]